MPLDRVAGEQFDVLVDHADGRVGIRVRGPTPLRVKHLSHGRTTGGTTWEHTAFSNRYRLTAPASGKSWKSAGSTTTAPSSSAIETRLRASRMKDVGWKSAPQRQARTARLSFSCQDRSSDISIRSSLAIDSCCRMAAK